MAPPPALRLALSLGLSAVALGGAPAAWAAADGSAAGSCAADDDTGGLLQIVSNRSREEVGWRRMPECPSSRPPPNHMNNFPNDMPPMDLVTTDYGTKDFSFGRVLSSGLTPFKLTCNSLSRSAFVTVACLTGEMWFSSVHSKVNPITVTGDVRKSLGIVDSAEFFAYAYPLVTETPIQVSEAEILSPNVAFLMLGGYMYFDSSMRLVDVRAIMLSDAGSIPFKSAQPWKADEWTVVGGLERWRPVTYGAMAEKGAKYVTWVTAGEGLVGGQGGSEWPDGAFVYLFHEPTQMGSHLAQWDVFFALGTDEFQFEDYGDEVVDDNCPWDGPWDGDEVDNSPPNPWWEEGNAWDLVPVEMPGVEGSPDVWDEEGGESLLESGDGINSSNYVDDDGDPTEALVQWKQCKPFVDCRSLCQKEKKRCRQQAQQDKDAARCEHYAKCVKGRSNNPIINPNKVFFGYYGKNKKKPRMEICQMGRMTDPVKPVSGTEALISRGIAAQYDYLWDAALNFESGKYKKGHNQAWFHSTQVIMTNPPCDRSNDHMHVQRKLFTGQGEAFLKLLEAVLCPLPNWHKNPLKKGHKKSKVDFYGSAQLKKGQKTEKIPYSKPWVKVAKSMVFQATASQHWTPAKKNAFSAMKSKMAKGRFYARVYERYDKPDIFQVIRPFEATLAIRKYMKFKAGVSLWRTTPNGRCRGQTVLLVGDINLSGGLTKDKK